MKNDNLVISNLDLVKNVVKSFEGKGLDYDELCSIGRYALSMAGAYYDVSKGEADFRTYATKVIKNEIKKELGKNSNRDVSYNKMVAFIEQYRMTHNGEKPSDEELAIEFRTTTEKVDAILSNGFSIVSFDASLNEDDDEDFGRYEDILSNGTDVPTEYVQSEITSLLGDALAKLEHTERTVVCDFYGFNGSTMSKNEIAKKNGLSVAEVVAILDRGMNKLKRNPIMKKIFELRSN